MARSRYQIHDPTAPHFITCTAVAHIPLFARRSAAEIILDSLDFLQSEDRITLYAYVIMENHLHLIAEAANLNREMQSFKSYTARRLIDRLKEERAFHALRLLRRYARSFRSDRQYRVWGEGSHAKEIMGDKMFVQKRRYIHENPVRRGYVDVPVHWRYSSARNYAGLKGLLEVTLVPC